MTTKEGKFEFKKISPVARNFLENSTAFINIAVGSIRSGKTITVLMRFIQFICSSKEDLFAMAGRSINTIDHNVVTPFCKMLNTLGVAYNYNKFNQEITLFFRNGSKKIILYGIEKEGAEARIQGVTLGGTMIDEMTVLAQKGVEMLISRNSTPDAMIFVTCNPTNPQSFVYTNYVNNQKAIKEGRFKIFNFLLEDNLNLTKEYIENIKASYSRGSVFYKRYLLNQWVSGQGMIFDSFSDKNILHEEINTDDYYQLGIGSDYGVSTTSCYSLIGIKQAESGKEYHLIDERYYNAEKEGMSQTDTQRVEDILRLQSDYNLHKNVIFWCSHDAGSLRAALEKDNRIQMSIDTFKPDTLDCIQRLSKLINDNKLMIHESCTETIKQIQGYEWDMKAAARGMDKPVKKDDHLVDSMRAPIMHDITGKHVISGIIRL